MEIPNQNDSDNSVTIIKSESHKGLVWLGIGPLDNRRSRHAHLRPAEAKAIAYALLSYAEQSTVDS